jgi:Soluble lytic murein transglycosylase and related regulatory proteins (some contain LysM/invasin domains)
MTMPLCSTNGGEDVALTVNDISTVDGQNPSYANRAGSRKTTITPFSEVLKQQEKNINASEAVKTAATKENISTEKTSSQKATSAANVAETKGTTGTRHSDGTLTTTLADIFRRASEKYGVSYDFLTAVAKAESNFNPNCVSSAGARGIMQIMPAEAKGLGIQDVFDAEQNIMGSAKLLAAHLKKFNGDTTLAAAAYNAGSGRVKQYGGVPPFKETQNYVKKIAAYMKESVTVPDKTVTVSPNKLSGDVTKSQKKEGSTSNQTGTDALNAVAATEEELNQSMVVVGSGEGAVKMTYGAYQRYLELGSLGVG